MSRALSSIAPVLALVVLVSCSRQTGAPNSSEYLHLHSVRMTDVTDIWIFPDDSFRKLEIRYGPSEIKIEVSGKAKGAFQRVVQQATDEKAWEISSASLRQDLQVASNGHSGQVFDGDRDSIEFRLKRHTLIADFCAARSFF